MKRIVVVGCGGIGGVIAACLVEAGCEVTAVTHNDAIADAITASGLTAVLDETPHHVTRITALPRLGGDGALFDLAVLAVPPNAAEEAVADTLPYLTDDAPILCCPNGLIEERLARTVPASRLIGGIVSFGATMTAPGEVRQTSRGGFTIGRLPAAQAEDDPTLDAVAELLEAVGPVQRTDNLRGARWSKLAINCAISSLGTVAGQRLGVVMRTRSFRRLALEVMTEVVEVARAEDIELKKVAGTLDLNWLALSAEERLRVGSPGLLAKHTVLLAVGAKFRKLRSSMLRAIERGREPSVDFLNGEIVEGARAHDIATPINAALQETVHAIARGELASDPENLRLIYERTRTTVREIAITNAA